MVESGIMEFPYDYNILVTIRAKHKTALDKLADGKSQDLTAFESYML